jgi:hypothetical protein
MRDGLATLIVLADMPRVDLAIYAPAEERYVHTAELLKLIGFSDRPTQADVTVPLGPWAYLMLRVVESQRGVEEQRLRHADEEGLRLSRAHLGALVRLADELRRQVGAPPRRVTAPSVRQAHFECRRLARRSADARSVHASDAEIRCRRLPRQRGNGR